MGANGELGNGTTQMNRVSDLKLPKLKNHPSRSRRPGSGKRHPQARLFQTSSFPPFSETGSAASPDSSENNAISQEIRAEYRRQAEAEKDQIVTSAEVEAAGILITAEADAENLKRATVEEAKEAGLKESQEIIKQHLTHLDELFASLKTTQKRCYQQHEEALIKLALTCAEKIINREISLDETVIVDTVNEILREGQIQGDTTLLLNREDFDLIDVLKPEILADFPNLTNLKIEVSETVARGGCILESPMGRIDASLRSKFEELERLLTNG
jgi:flagellar assembly protein FliH